MKKRILVIGINNKPELTGIGHYTGEMLDWLVAKDHEVTMITAFAYYPQWKIQRPYAGRFYKKEVFNKGKLTLYRCPLYVPAEPTGFKRLIHEASFFLSAFFVVLRLLFKKKYDLVFCVAPPFHLGFLALFYRFFKGSKVMYHIQDLQVDAAKELKLLKPGWLISLLFRMERWILRKADRVSTLSDGMKEKVAEKVNRQVDLFPNWVDTALYFPMEERSKLKEKWGFSASDYIVLYSGSIGEKQGLDALGCLAESLAHVKVVICGTGPYKERLVQLVKRRGLLNVHFFPLQEPKVFNAFLNMADLHLVLQKGDASDLVMPSKLSTILAVGGLVLVTAHPGTSLYKVIIANRMGLVIPPQNDQAFRIAVSTAYAINGAQVQRNARNYAEHHLDKERILCEVFKDI